MIAVIYARKPTSMSPMPAQVSSQDRRAQRALAGYFSLNMSNSRDARPPVLTGYSSFTM